MKLYALTGNIAAGKSTVARRLASHGAVVIDADAIVHAVQQPGSEVFRRIVAHFGETVVAADGSLDRVNLRQLVFSDPTELKALEAIVHPEVAREQQRLIDRATQCGAAVVIVDIPLLFEKGDPDAYDGVILVDAPVAERRRRLIEDRGFAPDFADRLIASQWPSGPKRARATWTLDNDSDRDAILAQADRLWTTISR